MRVFQLFLVLPLLASTYSCQGPARGAQEQANRELRIISLGPAFTEALALAGKLDQVVGVDVTSSYPDSVVSIPILGHVRNLKAESMLALDPDVVIAFSTDLDPALSAQLSELGIRLWLVEKKYTPQDLVLWVQMLEDSLHVSGLAERVSANVSEALAELSPIDPKPRVLFIYARGAGALSVAGAGTSAEAMVELAGGEYAVKDFDNFKPLTPEALVAANPDILLLFEDGLQSLGGVEGLLQVPGVSQTSAGKRRAILTMDGNLLLGFGPRLGEAASLLNQKMALAGE